MREGFIVRSHGEITTISADQRCVFQGQIAHMIAEVIADPIAEAIAEQNGENCIGSCIGQPPQQSEESSGYGEPEKVFPEFGKSLGPPGLLTSKPSSPLAFPTHGKSDEPEAIGMGLFGFPTFDSTEKRKIAIPPMHLAIARDARHRIKKRKRKSTYRFDGATP